MTVNGLGGKKIESEDEDLAHNEWWASVYTAEVKKEKKEKKESVFTLS
jgi:hypothetical protein